MLTRKRRIYLDITMVLSSPGEDGTSDKLGNLDHRMLRVILSFDNFCWPRFSRDCFEEVTPNVSALQRSLLILVISHHIYDSLSNGPFLLL